MGISNEKPVLRKFAEVTEVCGSSSKTFKMDSNCHISSILKLMKDFCLRITTSAKQTSSIKLIVIAPFLQEIE